MASTFVDEALQDLQLLSEKMGSSIVDDLQMGLKALRTFLLCAGKRHNDVCFKSDENTSSPMGSLLSRLEYSLIQNGKDFHNLCLRAKNASRSDLISSRTDVNLKLLQLRRCIYSFKQQISESYIALADYCSLQSRDQSTEFIDALLLNMADIRGNKALKDPFRFENLKEKFVFFKNFLRFLKLRGLDPWQFLVLFTHLQVVDINVARVCQEWMLLQYDDRKKLCNEFQLKLSVVLPTFKTADPQIREIYVHFLMASSIPGSSHTLSLEWDKHVLQVFFDSLLYKNWEALTYDDSYMVSVKDEVPMFYEGLRFLRTILTKHFENTNELHEKAKDLIGAAINDCLVICSHEFDEDLAKEMKFALSSFVEKIKLIKVITSASIFPRTNEHGFVDFGFVDFLLDILKELPSCKVDSIAFAKDQIQKLQEDFVSLISFLESVQDQRNRDGKLLSFWSRVAEVAYKTRFVIESLVVGNNPDCSPLEFNPITEEINLIKMEASKFRDNQYSFEAQKADKISSPSQSQDNTPGINNIEGPLDDEANKIIELLKGSTLLDIISIVGMPGLGKTTLARRVYDDPSVRENFHARAWCVVSHVYKKKHLLLQILGSVDPDFSDEKYSKENDEKLEEKLKKCLLRKRYLVVLDDVWDTEAWSGLKNSFPENAKYPSRILITSRHVEEAKEINPYSEPYSLGLLSDDQSWDLLKKKLAGKESDPSDLGKRIAINCKGLPLTIVIVAGILANLEPDRWTDIARRLSDLPILDQCMDMLEVSYEKLPENLKSCLLYFGAFREGEAISCKKLIWLWIAEGFVQKSEAKSLEDVAKDYMNNLISRSLVMVSKERSMGGVKTCRIHDLLHEFCVKKSKTEKFMSVLRGHDEIFTFQVQRLCVHSTLKHFVESRPFSLGVRSLLFFSHKNHSLEYNSISHIFHFFKLEVLDLSQSNLNFDFPREILLLVELRYLAVETELKEIPSSIAKLSKLETLVLVDYFRRDFFLPVTIWNMSKLRVLWSNGNVLLSVLDKDNLERSSNLHNLYIFSLLKLSYGQSMEKIMRKLPSLRRLKCQLFESGESNADCNRIVVMDFLSQLESLDLLLPKMGKYPIGFRFPVNLKKLSLSGFHSSIIPKGGELPNLVVLKLDTIDFEGGTWDMNEEWKFPNLKFLELQFSNVERWTGTDDSVDHFPLLEKLVLQSCEKLKEVPSCLGDIQNLQMIEVDYCPKSVESSILQIKERQHYGGNENLRVLLIDIIDDEVEDDPCEDEMEDDPSEDEMEDEPSEDETEDDPCEDEMEDEPSEDEMMEDEPNENEMEDDPSEDDTEDETSDEE